MDRHEKTAGLESGIRTALKNHQAHLWTALPGIVESFDASANTVVVQPTVKGLINQPSGVAKAVDLPLLPDVPVYFPRGGGVTLTFPVSAGDECLVVFSSRCIDGWWQSGGVQLAPEFRMHDLSDGFALIGPMSQPNVISNISTSAAQLRTDDGSAYVELTPAGVVNGTAQSWNVVGDLNVTGKITASGDVVGNGISLDTHTHSDPQGGNVGQPQ